MEATYPAECLWRDFVKLGRCAWAANRCYLPRALWKCVEPSLTKDPLGGIGSDWNQELKAAIRGVNWKQLWCASPKQRLLRKMLGIVCHAPLSRRTFLHVAYNVGQIEASGAIDDLRRLTIRDPQEAEAIHAVCALLQRLRLCDWRTFISEQQASAITADEVEPLRARVSAAWASVHAVGYPEHTTHQHNAGIIVALVLVVVFVVALGMKKMVDKLGKSKGSARRGWNAALAVVGVGAGALVASCAAHKHHKV